ncbi:MAG: glycosyltransferase [Desulfatiglandaceae bacterium]
MNICMFTNTYLPHVGGVARSVALFTEDLQALGHPVLVVAPVFPDDLQEERQEDILRVPAIQNFNGSDFSLRIAVPFRIANKIEKFQPDIIHSHHPYLLGDAALRTAWRRNLPLVFTHHTLYEKYTHYVPLDSENMQRFVINLSTEYANLCSRVIAPSRSVAKLIKARGVTTPIEEIPTGVDLDFFDRGQGDSFLQAHGISNSKPVIGHVGRLAPEKNLRYLAEAAALFLKDHPGVFLVVGAGPSEKEILDTFNKMGIEQKVILAGQKTGQELSDAYSAMDLFLFASKTETQGMVVAEAMAAGRPVIALDASGIREVVEDGRNGRLLHADASRAEFARAVKEFISNPEKAEQWRQGALETAASFGRKETANRLVGLYERVSKPYKEAPQGADELNAWDRLLGGLKAEWALISEKAAASVAALSTDDTSS